MDRGHCVKCAIQRLWPVLRAQPVWVRVLACAEQGCEVSREFCNVRGCCKPVSRLGLHAVALLPNV